jgi:hypothetical protein
MAVETTEEAKALVYAWMENLGYSPKEDTTSHKDLKISLQGMSPLNIPIIIIQPSESKANFIVVIVNVNVTDPSYKSLSEMGEESREDLLWNLKRDLIFAPSNFSFEDDETTGIIRRAQFSKIVYFEELSEGRLAEAVDYTIRSALWMIWTFKKKLRSPQKVRPVE